MGKHFTDFGIFAPKHFTDFGKIRLKHFLLIHYLSIKQADGAMGYLGIMLIMRYHDDGGTLMVQLGKQMHHLGTILGIEVTRRLIGKDELRTKDHGTGDSYPLLLTT